MRKFTRPILGVLAGFLFTPCPAANADPGTTKMGSSVATPTLETLQTGLDDMLERLHLKHWQREQVERMIASEAVQLQQTRGNPDLSVAEVFSRERAIRLRTRRQIESILTPVQRQRVTELIVRKMVKREDRADDF